MRDSGGLFAKFGPLTTDAKRPDGQWVRVKFHRPISRCRAGRFADAIRAGTPIPPTARVTVAEIRTPYQLPGVDVHSEPWHEISGAPVGELPHGGRYECRVALDEHNITIGTYRESWLGEWHWYDLRGRKIEPKWFAVIVPPPPPRD